jgi:hypothetical protein
MEFKIGDIVRINTVSQISNQGKWSDGTFMDGEVTETKYGSGSICLCVVRWENGISNIFNSKKLIINLKVYRDNQINNILDGI